MKRAIYMCLVLMTLMLAAGCKPPSKDGDDKGQGKAAIGERVALDFHIMSKCPFGVKVLQAITPVIEKMGDW